MNANNSSNRVFKQRYNEIIQPFSTQYKAMCLTKNDIKNQVSNTKSTLSSLKMQIERLEKQVRLLNKLAFLSRLTLVSIIPAMTGWLIVAPSSFVAFLGLVFCDNIDNI